MFIFYLVFFFIGKAIDIDVQPQNTICKTNKNDMAMVTKLLFLNSLCVALRFKVLQHNNFGAKKYVESRWKKLCKFNLRKR